MEAAAMNGAESIVRTLVGAGVDTCFANPGTSEMHFVAALDRVPGMRPILGLFEGAVSGMADGYGRMADKPAVTLLHLGTGLGNAIANLHNARRAQTPIVNIVGEHATFHLQWDSPLVADIAGLARPVSKWVHTTPSSLTAAADTARAVAEASAAPGGVATLILPANAAWDAAAAPAPALPATQRAAVSGAAVDRAVTMLRSGRKTVILTRGLTLREDGLEVLGRIAAATGAQVIGEGGRLQRGAGRVAVGQVSGMSSMIEETYRDVAHLILVGSQPPVGGFAYPDRSSWSLPAGLQIHYLAHPHEDGLAALASVAEALGAKGPAAHRVELALPAAPTGALDQHSIGAVVARHLPDGAVISEEAATNRMGPHKMLAAARPHDWMTITGGAIGQGIPVAAGAAVACPGRKVINLQADGSGMYTLQALWTQARERLDVVTVIFANRSYAVLKGELNKVGAKNPGPTALSMLDLGNPDLSWVDMARGMGVEASRAETVAQFEAQFVSALAGSGPRLIEAMI
jgi:acetolactate synthase-1/2/3 large subunit